MQFGQISSRSGNTYMGLWNLEKFLHFDKYLNKEVDLCASSPPYVFSKTLHRWISVRRCMPNVPSRILSKGISPVKNLSWFILLRFWDLFVIYFWRCCKLCDETLDPLNNFEIYLSLFYLKCLSFVLYVGLWYLLHAYNSRLVILLQILRCLSLLFKFILSAYF